MYIYIFVCVCVCVCVYIFVCRFRARAVPQRPLLRRKHPRSTRHAPLHPCAPPREPHRAGVTHCGLRVEG